MANKVTMNICGQEYTLVADESAEYMKKVGALVDQQNGPDPGDPACEPGGCGSSGGGEPGGRAAEKSGRRRRICAGK